MYCGLVIILNGESETLFIMKSVECCRFDSTDRDGKLICVVFLNLNIIGSGFFFQTQKAEMTIIVGKTFRLVLPILRRAERGAEKNPE